MTQGENLGVFDRVVDFFANRKPGELEQIEHILEGMIGNVEPRGNFRKELGDRLNHREDISQVEVEKSPKFRRPILENSSRSSDVSLLVTGLFGGLILILMGVRLLIYFRGRNRSTQP